MTLEETECDVTWKGQRLIPVLVFARMDGRSNKWLSDKLAEEGITLTGSAISNYRLGLRQPDYATLEAINRILSIRATSERNAVVLKELRRNLEQDRLSIRATSERTAVALKKLRRDLEPDRKGYLF